MLFQVCVKLNESLLRDATFFESIGIFEKHHNLYQYIDKQRREKLDGKTISSKNIKKAREELKSYKAEMDEFLSNFRRTKQNSTNSYMKMLEELENLKKPKKATCKHSRSFSLNRSPTALSNDLLMESFHIIKINQENIQKVQADLAAITKTQEKLHTAFEKISSSQEKILQSLGKFESKTELEDKFRHSAPGAFDE